MDADHDRRVPVRHVGPENLEAVPLWVGDVDRGTGEEPGVDGLVGDAGTSGATGVR